MKKVASGYRLIFGYLGLFIMFVGLVTMLPLFALFAFPEEAVDWYCFVIPGVSAIVLGFLLYCLIIRRKKAQLGKLQDSVLLVMVWVSSILISAVPFLIKGNLGFTDAVFETTSAYSTIGLTVFKESDYNLHVFVLYRSIMCFFGGVGLVLIVTSAISDRYGLKLYTAEGHNDKLMPNLGKSARLILTIYTGIIVTGVILYVIAGMPVFDAIVHSISAVATGGFSSRPGGLATFQYLDGWWAIELISIFLMLAGALNFLNHMFLLTGKFKKFIRDCEVRLFGILCLIFIPLFFVSAFSANGWTDPFHSLINGTFTFVSSFTTTGFTNVSNLLTLGEGVVFLVFIGTIIGGGMGSTAGGVKLYRVAVAAKSFYWTTKEKVNSSNMIYPHYVWRSGEHKEVTSRDASEAFGYILIYLLLILVGSFLMTILGPEDFGRNMFEFSNSLSSNGMTNGITQTANIPVKWVLIVGMFAGRLEILSIYFGFYRLIKDIFRKEIY